MKDPQLLQKVLSKMMIKFFSIIVIQMKEYRQREWKRTSVKKVKGKKKGTKWMAKQVRNDKKQKRKMQTNRIVLL